MRFNLKNPVLAFLAGKITKREYESRIKLRSVLHKQSELVSADAIKRFMHDGFDVFYMSHQFNEALINSHSKIWTRDFRETHVFKKSQKIVINKSGVFLTSVFSEGTFLNVGACCVRVMNDGSFTDSGILLPDGGWQTMTESMNNNETDKYKRTIAYMPVHLDAFLRYAPKEFKILSPKKRVKLYHCKYTNDLPFKVNLLDLNYYTESIQNSEFPVRGHWKMQAYGKGMKKRKLKWIDTYTKKRYIKGAYKETILKEINPI